MSFFDELGLKAAEQLEESVGPYIALASYKRLYAGPTEIKAQAAVGAIRCAIALEDDREIEMAIAQIGSLASAPGGASPSALSFAVELLIAGKPELANHLAQAELERRAEPMAAYVKARALEATLGKAMDACALWNDVVERARGAGEGLVQTHASSRFVAACLARTRKDERFALPRAHIALVCEKAKLDGASAEERLLICRGKLLSASNFQRASALSAIEETARRERDPVRSMAIAMAARHFDEMPFHLHAIEIDRVRATLKHVASEEIRAKLVARVDATVAFVGAWADKSAERPAKIDAALDGVARASEIARAALARIRAAERGGEGAGSSGDAGTAFDRVCAHAVSAIVAVDKRNGKEARTGLDRARELLSPDITVPLPAWSAARVALASEMPDARAAAVELVSAAFARTTSLPPPPLVNLATLLGRAGAPEVAAVVLEEATRFKEPEARAASAETRRRLAYDALVRGDRETAWVELRAARELFGA